MATPAHSHDNLREALIASAIELLNEGGLAALTLRRAAARAGVSHAAPAHHFDGLPGLLTAIATRAYAGFSDQMEAKREAMGQGAFERLSGVCAGYLAFAEHHAGLFQVMFTTPTLDRTDAELNRASLRAYGILRDACAPFASSPPEALELAVWSLVHGYAFLGFNTYAKAGAAPGRAFEQVPPFDELLRRLVLGA